jgi:hypothetical protein
VAAVCHGPACPPAHHRGHGERVIAPPSPWTPQPLHKTATITQAEGVLRGYRGGSGHRGGSGAREYPGSATEPGSATHITGGSGQNVRCGGAMWRRAGAVAYGPFLSRRSSRIRAGGEIPGVIPVRPRLSRWCRARMSPSSAGGERVKGENRAGFSGRSEDRGAGRGRGRGRRRRAGAPRARRRRGGKLRCFHFAQPVGP